MIVKIESLTNNLLISKKEKEERLGFYFLYFFIMIKEIPITIKLSIKIS